MVCWPRSAEAAADHVAPLGRCPHFRKGREKHKDAWAGRQTFLHIMLRHGAPVAPTQVNRGCKNNPHQMGAGGGGFVLRPACFTGLSSGSLK